MTTSWVKTSASWSWHQYTPAVEKFAVSEGDIVAFRTNKVKAPVVRYFELSMANDSLSDGLSPPFVVGKTSSEFPVKANGKSFHLKFAPPAIQVNDVLVAPSYTTRFDGGDQIIPNAPFKTTRRHP